MHRRRILTLFLLLTLVFTSCSDVIKSSTYDSSSGIEIAPSEDTTQFHFIDVGQGDCIFIQNGETTILIDSGTYESGHKIYEYLTSRNITELDYFIATHPHDDHIGGAESILRSIDVDTVFMSTESDDSFAFEKFVDIMIEKNITPSYPEFGHKYVNGALSFEFISPLADYNSVNDNSFVIMFEFGEIKALFTGDSEKKVESDFLARNENLKADILKVGHHGSRNASTSAFLNSVYPSVAVIQCGKDNSYGHPHEEALDRLSKIGCTVLRTDTEGTIVLSTDGKAITRSSGESYEIRDKAPQITIRYIGNKKSKNFHIDSCPNLPGRENSVEFSSRDEAVNSGYKPCGNCNP